MFVLIFQKHVKLCTHNTWKTRIAKCSFEIEAIIVAFPPNNISVYICKYCQAQVEENVCSKEKCAQR